MTTECRAPGEALLDVTLQPTIVVVEDPMISNLVRAVLTKRGYQVMVVDRSEAEAVLRRSDGQAILMTNQPADFLEFSGHVPLVYVSSNPDPRWRSAFSACRVVPKPFSPQGLTEAVADLWRAP